MTAPLATALSAERPFPGLRPFAFEDHDFFFGREEQSYSLYRLIDHNRFIAVVGSSGSGKSSLVRAGLLPLLEEENRDAGGRTWVYREMRPGDAPLALLTELLANLAKDDDPGIAAARRERIAGDLRRSSFGIVDALRKIDGLGEASLLLVVDQFEELFRYTASATSQRRDRRGEARSRDEAAQFVQLLREVSRSRACTVHVLLTMRSDFIGDCARFHGLPEAVSAVQFLVPALMRDQLEEGIRKPIEKADATIEPALVERLLNDSSDELDQLPVLQHCLLRLWEQAGHSPSGETAAAVASKTDGAEPGPRGRHLDPDHYLQVGGMAGALSQHAEEILSSLSGLEIVVEQVFRALAEVDKEGRAIRRALPFRQLLAETGVPEHDLRRVLDRFRADDCSFLTPSLSVTPTLASNTRIDVGHEALLRQWERVSGRSGEILGDGADVASLGWLRAEERSGRRYRVLLSMIDGEGADKVTLPLHQVEDRWKSWNSRPRTAAWAERYGGNLDRVQRLFADSLAALEANRAAQRAGEVARHKRQFRTRAATAAGLAAALGLAGFMTQQWQWAVQARKAEERAHYMAVQARQTAEHHQHMEQEARQAAEHHHHMATEQQNAAEQNFTVALDSTRKLLVRIQDYLNSGAVTTTVANGLLTTLKDNLRELENIKQTPATIEGRALLWTGFSDLYVTTKDTAKALQLAEDAKALAEQLVAKDPTNDVWQKLVYSSAFRIGDSVGDDGRAMREYQTALKVAQHLAAKDPTRDDRLQNVGFVINKIGDVLKGRGDPDGSLREYNRALEIAEQLARKQPSNSNWQREIATAHTRIGDLLKQKGDLDGALSQYERALPIREMLVGQSPDDHSLKSNLSVGYNRIAEMLQRRGKFDDALEKFKAALTLREQLAANDPDNGQWQSYLSHEHVYIGDLLMEKGDAPGAQEYYRKALAIREELVKQNADDFDGQRNLAVSHDKLGDALAAQQRRDEALRAYRAALPILEKVATERPDSATRQRELAANRIKVGDILTLQDDRNGALQEYGAARDIFVRLAAQNPKWNRELEEAEKKILQFVQTQ